jgi:hypothetical protein
MTPGRYNITVYQGSTWVLEPQWKIGSSYVDVTGYTAAMDVRYAPSSTTSIIELTSSNGRIIVGSTNGKFTLQLDNQETAALPAGSYVYDLEITAPDGTVTRLLEGGFNVSPEVTR